MNKKQLLLDDYFLNEKSKNSYKKSPHSDFQKLQELIETTYLQVSAKIQKADLQIQLDPQIEDINQKIISLSTVIDFLLERDQQTAEQKKACQDCQNYQRHLQKLQADVRQHIRLQQQLKLYQDNIQQKNEQAKKENKQLQKQIQNLKRKIDEYKNSYLSIQEKYSKLENQNGELKNEIQYSKYHKKDNDDYRKHHKEDHYSKYQDNLDKKQNQLRNTNNITQKFPLTRTITFSSNLNKNQIQQRKSIEKKIQKLVESKPEIYRQSLNNKSANLLRPPSQRKKFQQKSTLKDKQNQRKRINKIDYRR